MRAVSWSASGVGGHSGRWHAGGLAPHVRYERLLRVEARPRTQRCADAPLVGRSSGPLTLRVRIAGCRGAALGACR